MGRRELEKALEFKIEHEMNDCFIGMEENIMRYADYDTYVSTKIDLEKYRKIFEKDIEDKKKELSDFVDRANKRIQWVEECEINKNYCILGRTMKDGKNKLILLIVRYPDGTQRDEGYSFNLFGFNSPQLAA